MTEVKNRNKKIYIIIAIAVAVLLIIGAVAAGAISNKDAKRSEEKSTESTVSVQEETEATDNQDAEVKEESTKTETVAKKETAKKTTTASTKTTNKTDNSSKNTSSSSTSKNNQSTSSTKPSHTHSWTAVYKEVDNGYYETKTISYTKCHICGADISGFAVSHMEAHLDKGEGGSYGSAVRYEKVWVPVIEKVVDYYKCSCGATK